MAKKLAKAQMGKVIKAAGKRAIEAVERKKEMGKDLKAGAALAAASAGWMAVNRDAREKKKGPYSPFHFNQAEKDSVYNTRKKKSGGQTKTKKKK